MKKWQCLFVALALSLGVGGWSTSSVAKTINLTFRFNDPEQKAMRAALDTFEKENPGIKVKLESIAWGDARNQFLREAATGTGPDVVHIAFVWAKEMAQAGAILPLGPEIKSNPPAGGLKDYIGTDLARGKNGKLYALPWTVDTWAMVYRTDLLKKAGIGALPKTWQDLQADSKIIHDKTGKTGFGFPAGSASSGSIWFLANYYWWGNGKTLVKQQGDKFSVGVDAADVASAMTYFKTFLDNGSTPKSMLSASDWSDPSIIRGLVNGNIAIGIMPPATFRQVLDAYKAAHPGAPVPFTSGPVPSGSKGEASHLGGRMLAINANTAHPKAAWKLIQFLNSKAVFAGAYRSQFPARRSLLKSIDFGKAMKGFAVQMQHTRTWGAYANGPVPIGTLWNLTDRAFGAALSGQTAVQSAAADYVKQVESQMH